MIFDHIFYFIPNIFKLFIVLLNNTIMSTTPMVFFSAQNSSSMDTPGVTDVVVLAAAAADMSEMFRIVIGATDILLWVKSNTQCLRQGTAAICMKMIILM